MAWIADVYEKFESLCLEFEDMQEVENELLSMGKNIKQFCSEHLLDIFPSVQVAALKLSPEQNESNDFEDHKSLINDDNIDHKSELLDKNSLVNPSVVDPIKNTHADLPLQQKVAIGRSEMFNVNGVETDILEQFQDVVPETVFFEVSKSDNEGCADQSILQPPSLLEESNSSLEEGESSNLVNSAAKSPSAPSSANSIILTKSSESSVSDAVLASGDGIDPWRGFSDNNSFKSPSFLGDIDEELTDLSLEQTVDTWMLARLDAIITEINFLEEWLLRGFSESVFRGNNKSHNKGWDGQVNSSPLTPGDGCNSCLNEGEIPTFVNAAADGLNNIPSDDSVNLTESSKYTVLDSWNEIHLINDFISVAVSDNENCAVADSNEVCCSHLMAAKGQLYKENYFEASPVEMKTAKEQKIKQHAAEVEDHGVGLDQQRKESMASSQYRPTLENKDLCFCDSDWEII